MVLSLQSTVRLNDGVEIPILGLGVYQASPGRVTQAAVGYALEIGYRHIDTASIYGNEADVGLAVRESGIPRDEIFVTTKLWNDDQGYDPAIRACESSLRRLGLDYVDLYLIHWPVPRVRKESWRALLRLQREGKCRSIGVSNYMIHHLEELLGESPVAPSIDQVEFSPFLFRKELLAYCRHRGIQLEAYSPLTKGYRLDDPTVRRVAAKYGKTPAQILIRWSLQHGNVVIPKSVRPEHIRENSQVFDFQISEEDMSLLNSLDEGLATGWDPEGAP